MLRLAYLDAGAVNALRALGRAAEEVVEGVPLLGRGIWRDLCRFKEQSEQ